MSISYVSEDELGSLSESMRTLTHNFKGIIQDMGMGLSALGNGDFSVDSKAKELYVGEFAQLATSMYQIIDKLSSVLVLRTVLFWALCFDRQYLDFHDHPCGNEHFSYYYSVIASLRLYPNALKKKRYAEILRNVFFFRPSCHWTQSLADTMQMNLSSDEQGFHFLHCLCPHRSHHSVSSFPLSPQKPSQ